jgi:hypothetical protein
MENDKQILANKTFGKILSDGFNLFIKCYWKLFFPLALFQIISISLQVLLLTDIFWLYYKFGNIMIFLSAFTLFFLIGLVFNVIAMSTCNSFFGEKGVVLKGFMTYYGEGINLKTKTYYSIGI